MERQKSRMFTKLVVIVAIVLLFVLRLNGISKATGLGNAETELFFGYDDGSTPYITVYFWNPEKEEVKMYDLDGQKISFDFDEFKSEILESDDYWWKHTFAMEFSDVNGNVIMSEDNLIGFSFKPAEENNNIVFDQDCEEAIRIRIIIK